jgi:EAL domain-containing protein (putative c-di-GMP-specific phosphodiesterase class I)
MLDSTPSGKISRQRLHQAIEAGEFEVHYQPIVSIKTRRPVAMEALVRWRDPVDGLIPPDRFIPLAETTKLINPLGEFVLHQACTDAMNWRVPVKVAVNLSPVQFEHPDLGRQVARILAGSGLPPQRLELEITESVLLHDTVHNVRVLHQLRDLGLSIALDDFGTGYSSLSYLRTFPFDKIKIDRSFVGEMADVDTSAAIVCAVANLGRSLDIVTTAEGVETERQFALLRAAGCTQAQGYLFGRPCQIADFSMDEASEAAVAQDDADLTAQDIMLVRKSFALVVPIQDAAADLFYDRLFTTSPGLRAMFPTDMTAQKLKLMEVLAACIGKLHDVSRFIGVVKELGARHASYGVRADTTRS